MKLSTTHLIKNYIFKDQGISIKRWIIVATILQLGLFNGLSAYAADEVACQKALKEGDYLQAVSAAKQSIQHNPKNRDAYLCQGRALDQLGQYAEAIEALQQAEKLALSAEDHMLGNVLLGDAFQGQQSWENALHHYQTTLQLSQQHRHKPFERVALNKTGDVYLAQQQADKALPLYQKASVMGRNDDERAEDYERQALAYEALKQTDRAIEYYIKATQKFEALNKLDNLAHGWLALGALYTASRHYGQAENSLNKLIELSKNYENQYMQAKAYIALAKTKRAKGETQVAEQLNTQAKALANSINAPELLKEIE